MILNQGGMERRKAEEAAGEDEIVCLDESFFINDNYQLTTFTFGSQVLQLFCLQSSSRLVAEKLEWGNDDDMGRIIQRYPSGFDLVLGADIFFDTVEQLLCLRGGNCKFILAYVCRAKMMDAMVVDEAIGHGMKISEVNGTRSVVRNLEGVIYEIKL